MADGQYAQEYLAELVRKSGQSRATVYRKLKDGWTETEIIARRRGAANLENPQATSQISTEPPPDNTKFALTWAEAVLWAADNVDESKKQMTKRRAGSALRYNLYLLGKENLRELHCNLVPKALSILDKQKNAGGGAVAEAEEKNIAELKDILKQALEESNRLWMERN